MEVNTYVVFNRPLLLIDDDEMYKPIYGIVCRKALEEKEINRLDGYVQYLCVWHCFYNGGLPELRIDKKDRYHPEWIDRLGISHSSIDAWSIAVGKKCQKRLALSYQVYELGTDYPILCDEKDNFIKDVDFYNEVKYLIEDSQKTDNAKTD